MAAHDVKIRDQHYGQSRIFCFVARNGLVLRFLWCFPGCLTPQNAESQYWLIFLRKFKFCVLRIFVYSVIMDLCIYM